MGAERYDAIYIIPKTVIISSKNTFVMKLGGEDN